MEDFWAHPIVVASYVAFFSLAVTGIRALFKLFDRVKTLEVSVRSLDDSLVALSSDVREHMAEETTNSAHLEASIRRIEDMIIDSRRPSFRE
jgi:hypothetical protein